MSKKYFLYIIFSLSLLTFVLQSSFAAGADIIFTEIGQDKPLQWDEWPRKQKHDYYKSLGIYPDSQGHYSGETGSLDLYFSLLGKTEPANWDSMTFAEKKTFVQVDASEKEDFIPADIDKLPVNQSQIDISQKNTSVTEKTNKKIPYIYFIIFGIGLGSIMMLGAYKTDK